MGAAQDKEAALVSEFNDATNAVAARIDRIIAAAQAADGLTAAELETAFRPVVTGLQALGSDPANPIPALPPEVTRR
jgi:hypothetical protein